MKKMLFIAFIVGLLSMSLVSAGYDDLDNDEMGPEMMAKYVNGGLPYERCNQMTGKLGVKDGYYKDGYRRASFGSVLGKLALGILLMEIIIIGYLIMVRLYRTQPKKSKKK